MKLACLFARHRPSLTSIIVRDDRFTALCDRCGAPIERNEARRWVDREPLIARRDQAA